MQLKKLTLLLLTFSILFSACNNDDNNPPLNNDPLGDYDHGVLILNQGNFGQSNSSISFWADDFSTFQMNAFSVVNPELTLGDTGQDIGFYEDKAFVVMNFSNTIQVLNRYTLEHITTISGQLVNPRYIAFANGKAYVTNWGDGGNPDDDYIAIINLNDYTVSGTIPVAEGPERIITHDNKLYVAHYGGYNFNNIVTVINSSNNTPETTITVGDGPNGLAVSGNDLWVICSGKPSWTTTPTQGGLYRIELNQSEVTDSFLFEEENHPSNLAIASNNIYYTVDSDIFRMNLNDSQLPSQPLFSTVSQGVYGVYSFAVTSDHIFVGDAADYNSNGKVYVYSLNGTLQHQQTVGVIPAGFYFNN